MFDDIKYDYDRYFSCNILCHLCVIGYYLRGDCWATDDQEIEIKEGSVVRLRIQGFTIEAGAIVSVLPIRIVNNQYQY